MKIGGGTKPSDFLSGKVVAYIIIIIIITIIIDNFCVALFSGVHKTHCALQHSATFSKFHKRNTYNYDN